MNPFTYPCEWAFCLLFVMTDMCVISLLMCFLLSSPPLLSSSLFSSPLLSSPLSSNVGEHGEHRLHRLEGRHPGAGRRGRQPELLGSEGPSVQVRVGLLCVRLRARMRTGNEQASPSSC